MESTIIEVVRLTSAANVPAGSSHHAFLKLVPLGQKV
jgi:hypothetical protein